MKGNGLPTAGVDENWWEILKEAAAKSADEEPFLTFVSTLLAMVIVTLGPLWLVLHYRYLSLKTRQKVDFERIRNAR